MLEEFTLLLRDAQHALDVRIAARISGDPGPYRSYIRGGAPDDALWAAARQRADLDVGDGSDEKILRARLADVVDALQADAEAAVVVEVNADGIAVSRVGLDRFGSPWLDRAASMAWISLLPMLSSVEHEQYFQLAGGLSRLDRAVISDRLRAVPAGLPGGDLLVICRPAGWPVLEWAAAAIVAVRPGAQLLRVAGLAGGVPAGTVLASLTTEAPLRDPYQLVVAEIDDVSGEVREQGRQLFARGDIPGTECRVPLRRPPGDAADTAVAIFSAASVSSEPIALFSVPLPPGQAFDLRVILDGPGRVRIVSPTGAEAYPGTWAQVRSEIPDRVDVTPGPADLVCAVDLAGPVPAVRGRLRLVRSLLELLAEKYDDPGWLRVSVLTCTDHDFERGRENYPVVKGIRLGPVVDAVAWFARQTAASVRYPGAAPVEDLLHEASIMLAESQSAGRAARLLLVGGRRPHPFPQGTDKVLRCPLRYRWQESLRRLTGPCGARCVAVADAVPSDGAQAAMWEALGPAGLRSLPATTAQLVGEDLALLARHAQRIPIPLSNPE